MTIQEAQEAVDQWIKQYGVRYFSELTNMDALQKRLGSWLESFHVPMETRILSLVRSLT